MKKVAPIFLAIVMSCFGSLSCTNRFNATSGSLTPPSNSPGNSFFLGSLPNPPTPIIGGGQTYYVSPTGNDANSGTSLSSPFLTLQHAADLTNPGDIVYAMSGTYTTSSTYVLWITRSGTPNAWITYQAYPGQHPVIQVGNNTWSWAGIAVSAPSPNNGVTSTGYIVISGFEVIGNNANVSWAKAQANANNGSDATTNSTGIDIGLEWTAPAPWTATSPANTHHIVVQNNVVHDNPLGGIGVAGSDYTTVQGNTVYGNSLYSPYAGSGISIWDAHNIDTNPGYHVFVVGNISHDNVEYIGNMYYNGGITDGNGIIIDSNRVASFSGRTLVANNLIYNNGGSGIHAFNSQHADFMFNTAYMNNSNIQEGEIFSNTGTDIQIMSNIMYARSGSYVNSNCSNDGTVVSNYNTEFNGTAYGCGSPANPLAQGSHDHFSNPLFVNGAPIGGNFHLQSGSPAIGTGNPALIPSMNLDGTYRSAAPNSGAY